MAFPHVSFAAPTSELANSIGAANHGVLVLTDLPAAPIESIKEVFNELKASKEIGNRLNKAYTKNLVYKDSFSEGQGGAYVDQKRVLDLSPERLAQIAHTEPSLAEIAQTELTTTMTFWQGCASVVMPKLLEATSAAVGSDVAADAHCNFRMVDYYERSELAAPPRCGEHRDFGTATLIFASDAPGLEVMVDGVFQPAPPIAANSAILLFGWCTQIRSNGRIPAALHRVVDAPAIDGVIPRRTSAVLFIAPKDVGTPLEPVVKSGEARQYISGVKVGQLRGGMARKWRHREGTLNAADRELEEEEIRTTKMATQDDVVRESVAYTSERAVGVA